MRKTAWIMSLIVSSTVIAIGFAEAQSFPQLSPVMVEDLTKAQGQVENIRPGNEILVVQMWASWCLNCSSITPKVAQAVADSKRQGVRFATVSIDDERDDAVGYIRKHRALFDGLNLSRFHDPAGRGFKQFGLQGIPATVILYPDGSHHIFYGATDPAALRSKLN